MGASGSKEKLLNSLPETGERFYGLENFGNTCYANSVRRASHAQPIARVYVKADADKLATAGKRGCLQQAR